MIRKPHMLVGILLLLIPVTAMADVVISENAIEIAGDAAATTADTAANAQAIAALTAQIATLNSLVTALDNQVMVLQNTVDAIPDVNGIDMRLSSIESTFRLWEPDPAGNPGVLQPLILDPVLARDDQDLCWLNPTTANCLNRAFGDRIKISDFGVLFPGIGMRIGDVCFNDPTTVNCPAAP